MSNAMDKFKLIAEIRKRPALWDTQSKEHSSKKTVQARWKNVAVAMGSDVTANECSRKWKSLRDRYRVVAKKIELSIAKDKLNGTYDPNNEYKCEWVFYEHMKFINDIQKSNPMELNDNKSEDNDSNHVSTSHNMDNNTKMDENNSSDDQEMDRLKLIAEIRKRPALWDFKSEEHRSRKTVPTAWKDVAVAMGSDVNDCSRMWRYLRDRTRAIMKKTELRIQEAKLNGSYNPNNDYGSQWPYSEHMKFVYDIKKISDNDNKSDLEKSNGIDKFKLIAEIRKRPALWDINSEEHRSKIIIQTAWKDVAVAMGSNVDNCSRTWQRLRSINREVVKKIELRIQEAKLKCTYNPNNEYSSQWPYFKHMDFINGLKLRKSAVNDNKSDDNGSKKVSKVNNMDNTKMDKFKLIAEIRKRPALWDINSEEHRSKIIIQTAWKDVAIAMGSNVNDCSRTWQRLRSINREVVKRIELRIQEAKLKCTYNPNNEYSSHWPYLKHMDFINGLQLGNSTVNDNKSDDSMDNTKMDKFKLIAEMRKRPALWDNQSEEHRSCLSIPEVWKDLAVSVGSDVKTCQHNWISLCRIYRKSVRRIESRIKVDKLNGSYVPNKDYSSKWPYFESLVFLKDIKTGPIKLPTSAEKLKLIAEVRNRPELWCIEIKKYVPRSAVHKSWEDLAEAMGADVNDCKRKWNNLLMAYRVEVRRLKLRIEKDKLKGSYNPNKEYRPKWFFYEHMQFCDGIKNSSPMKLGTSCTYTITYVNENNSDDNDSNQVSEFQNMDNIKMEPEFNLEPKEYLSDDEDNYPQTSVGVKSYFSGLNLSENQDPEDDKPTTSNWKCTKRSYDQVNYLGNFEKKEHNLTKSVKVEPELDLDPEVYISDDEDDDTDSQISGLEFLSEQNSPQNQESADDEPSSTGGNCTKRSFDQANLLDDLEKDEHNLIKSVRSNEMVPVTDSDYNFLVSFLPKMKKINELQNLQFRAKIIDLMLDIAKE